MIRVGSDFSGIGSFELALKRLGVEFESVFACDNCKFVKTGFLANNKTDKFYNDVRSRPAPKKSLDIYMTSPPCQSFSTLGGRGGVKDVRGNLFYNTIYFIRDNKPKFFIIENVKGFLNSNDFNDVMSDLVIATGGEYDIKYNVLNSKDFGVPQSRNRLFIVGVLKSIKFQFDFFEFMSPGPASKSIADILEVPAQPKYIFTDKKTAKYKARAEKYKDVSAGWFNIKPTDSIANCITTRAQGDRMTDTFINYKGKVRVLSPLECFRCQGFTDSEYNRLARAGLSKTRLYKMAGNTITINVLQAIISDIMSYFTGYYEMKNTG